MLLPAWFLCFACERECKKGKRKIHHNRYFCMECTMVFTTPQFLSQYLGKYYSLTTEVCCSVVGCVQCVPLFLSRCVWCGGLHYFLALWWTSIVISVISLSLSMSIPASCRWACHNNIMYSYDVRYASWSGWQKAGVLIMKGAMDGINTRMQLQRLNNALQLIFYCQTHILVTLISKI